MQLKKQSNIKFGLLGIIAIANVGCSTQRSIPSEPELDSFVINCSIKTQQVEYLQSLRMSKLELQIAALTAPFTVRSGALPDRHTNSVINDHIRRIQRECNG